MLIYFFFRYDTVLFFIVIMYLVLLKMLFKIIHIYINKILNIKLDNRAISMFLE